MEGVLGRRYDSTAKHVHVCVLICTTHKILEWMICTKGHPEKREKREERCAVANNCDGDKQMRIDTSTA